MKYYIKASDSEGNKAKYEVESDVTLDVGDIVFIIPDGRFFITDTVGVNTFTAMHVSGDEVDIYTYKELS